MSTPTPNMGLVFPVDTSSMSDVGTYLNNNWVRIQNLSNVPQVASLPAYDGNYSGGELLWLTDPTATGLYLCLGTNANWGTIWRPLSAPYGPWVRPRNALGNFNAILADQANYRVRPESPFRYRISNRGRVELTGAIEVLVGFWPSVGSGNFYPEPLVVWPAFFKPGSGTTGKVSQTHLKVAPYPATSTASLPEPQYANAYFKDEDNTFTVRARLDTVFSATAIYFSGAEFYLGDQGA